MITDTLKYIFRITSCENANRFIYYLLRLPFIGRRIPDSIYRSQELKKAAAVVASVLKFLGSLIGKVLFIGLLMVLPAVLLEKNTALQYGSFLHAYFFIISVGSLLSSWIFQNNRSRYICIRLLHMDAKLYLVSLLLFKELLSFISLLPVMGFTCLLLGGTFAQGLLLCFLASTFGLAGEAFFLMIYDKTGVILSKKPQYTLSVGALCLALTYIPLLLHSSWGLKSYLFHPVFLLLLLALFTLCLSYLLRFGAYREIAMNTMKADDYTIDTKQAMAQAKFADVAVREKDFTAGELHTDKFADRKGFAYLNAIFFARHRRLLVKPIRSRLIITAVLFAAAAAAFLLWPGLKSSVTTPGTILPPFVFIMYFASIGERVCRAMFYNCDCSLLRYAFYRERRAVLSNFKVRLLRIALLNLIIAGAVCIAVIALSLLFHLGWSLRDTVFFVLSILFLALFFSVHHLFLYYVFQPYTTELNMKNPLFSTINTIVYMLCYLSSRIKSPPSFFSLIVLASTFVYIVIALILVYKFSPTTFRVK